MLRGDIWWATLPQPVGSGPGFRRPVVLVQSDAFTRSRIRTVVVVVISSNERLALAPGNVRLPAEVSGLPRDSVANVSQIITIDKAFLAERCGRLPESIIRQIEEGLRVVLAL